MKILFRRLHSELPATMYAIVQCILQIVELRATSHKGNHLFLFHNFRQWSQPSCQFVHDFVSDFKTHNDLPLARIKRIMKADHDVHMIRAEVAFPCRASKYHKQLDNNP